jgi:hypothetical protein
MPRPQAVSPLTPLGEALERHRIKRGMTKAQACAACGWTNYVQWNRLLTEYRRFEPALVVRAAEAVGMDPIKALRRARVAIVPDDTIRVMKMSEVLALRTAS